jgi:hypothetical protein
VNLVYYSLSRSENGNYDRLWIQSIRSLRRYNQELPVCLLVYNESSEAILQEADRNNVVVYELGDYRDYLRRTFVHGSVLSMYPTLHKFLSLCELDTSDFSQVLYLDCDTFFFDDPAILFDTYTECDWYAREAPTSRRCPHGYDPSNIDETALESIVGQEGLTPILPFNAGVCLLNHGIWESFGRLRVTFLENVWRLLVGRHQRGADGSDDDIRNAVLRTATYFDHSRALFYPSNNFWIAEEIALWLTLGRVHGISQGFLSSDHVLQNREFASAIEAGRHWVLTHYFSSNEANFFSQVAELNE